MAILGIDEVGRGPWAGPLVIGAVVLKPRYDENENLVAYATGTGFRKAILTKVVNLQKPGKIP